MNYIYNIYINLQDKYYDYYEWLETDKINRFNKIPLIKIDNRTFKEIRLYKNRIYNKNGLLALTNSKSIFIIYIKNNKTISYSSINISDELDILPLTKKMKETKLKYKIFNKHNYSNNTRIEEIQKKYIKEIINKLDIDTLKYLYLECFNNEDDSKENISKKILKEVFNNNKEIINKIYDILKLVYIK